jgi:hypothetical protein
LPAQQTMELQIAQGARVGRTRVDAGARQLHTQIVVEQLRVPAGMLPIESSQRSVLSSADSVARRV